jgi:acetyltransferase AlgX (SGNH hydrolase-like protein)
MHRLEPLKHPTATPSRLPRIVRRLAIKTAVLLVSILVSVLILEAAVRYALPQYNRAGQISYQCVDGVAIALPNGEFRHWTKMGDFDVAVSTNQYGLRDTKDMADAEPDSLFAVGDSFSLGHGVEEWQRYSNQLETRLGRPVYNISVPTDLNGYLRLVGYALGVSPKIGTLIVGLCMENDIALYPSEVPPCKPGVDLSDWRNWRTNLSSMSLLDWKNLLTADSAAYFAITSVVHQQPTLKRVAMRLGLIRENLQFEGPRGYHEGAITSSAEKLAQIAARFDTIVLIIPSRGLWQGAHRETESRIHDRLVALLDARGIPTLDLRPVFERSGDPLQYHYPNDGHWNAEGHRVASDSLAEYLGNSPAP